MKCIASVEYPDKCIMCGQETVAEIKNGKIYVYSECSYSFQDDIDATLKKLTISINRAKMRLESLT